MYALALVLSLALSEDDVRSVTLTYDEHIFHSQTGCRIAGSVELQHLRRVGFFDDVDLNKVRAEIKCTKL